MAWSALFEIKSITRLLVIGFLVMISLMVLFASISLQENRKTAELSDKIYQHPFSVTNAVLEANSDIIAMHRYMKDVVLATNEDELARAIVLVEQHEKAVYGHFELIKERFLGEKETVNAAFSAFVDWKMIRTEVVTLHNNNQHEKAVAITMGKGAKHVELLTQRMDVMIDFARNKALEFKINSQKAYEKSVSYLYFLIVFIILSSVATAFFVITQVRKVEQARKENEERFEGLFSNSEISIWSEDFSSVQLVLNSLKDTGISDLKQYLQQNMPLVRELAGKVEVNYVNNATLKLFGVKTKDEFMSKIDRTFGSNAIEVFIDELCAIWDKQETFQSEVNFNTIDGKEFSAFITFRIPKKESDFLNIPVSIVDITAQVESQKLAEQEQQRFRDMVNATDGIVWEADAKTFTFTFISDQAERLLGYSKNDWYQPGFWVSHLHPEDKTWAPNYCASCTNKIEPHNFKYRFITAKGDIVWLHDLVTVVTENGEPRWLRGIMVDITAQKQTEQLIREERDRSQLYLDTVQSLMVALDTDGNITMVNGFGCEILGYHEQDLLGKNWFSTCLPPSADSETVHSYFDSLIAETNRIHSYLESEILKADGSRRLIAWRNSLLYDDQHQICGSLSSGEDITERKAAEREIHNLAFYDVLTGLPNRRLLMDRLQQSMAEGERSENYKALLFMDLDNFKNLNDTLGHDLGDQLLIETARRIQRSIRAVDTVSRHGGDEFIVLLEQLGSDLEAAAQRARTVAEKILDQHHLPYELSNQIYQGSISIGITLYRGEHHGHDELMKRADLAMYQAKKAGRNCFCFFDPEMQTTISLHTAMEHDLRKAIDEEEFELFYQPQVDTEGYCVGVEALIRWHSPEHGFTPPAEFIPVAEDSQLILPIGRWVIKQACNQLLQWQKSPSTDQLTLAVNVSAVQFKQDDFTQQVTELVLASGINATRLKLEITESMLMEDMDAVICKMTELKRLGISFSLDDFGTGYSSLSYVKLLPLDQLKIDQTFVRDILVDPNDAAICKAVIALGKSLGLHTIAEGVEQPLQWAILHDSGCEGAQGYLYARPMAIDDFMKWHKTHMNKFRVIA
ncbi:EAL domain-containing protein [Neptunomonas sp.]|uniref:EAL domain-containing protein n=1 Tax=Neptunomonas sp. TaxID=1971898 RepID=UPI0025F1D528|nr:EAL domain-containing protein [Neptunomonas sp.]